MSKTIPITILILALCCVSLASPVQAGTPESGWVRIATSSGIDALPVIVTMPPGRVVVAWAEPSATDEGLSAVRLAASPQWAVETLAEIPRGEGEMGVYAHPSPTSGMTLAWSYPQTDTLFVAAQPLDDPEPSTLPILDRGGETAVALDAQGGVHSMQAVDLGVTYHDVRRDVTATIQIAVGERISDLALAIDPQGQAHLAWTVLDVQTDVPLEDDGLLFYSPAGNGTMPTQMAVGRDPQILTGPEGRVHLCWRFGDSLYYTSSNDWSRLAAIDGDLEPDAPFALAVGPDDTAHVFWLRQGALWHAASPDWRLSKGPLAALGTTPLEVSAAEGTPASEGLSAPWHLDAAIDDQGQAHLVLAATAEDGQRGIYALTPQPVSPQLSITYPTEGMILSADAAVRAASNVPADALLRVEFYLQTESHSVGPHVGDLHDHGLLALDVDDDGSDGWQASLSDAQLSWMDRYRVVALATDRQGRVSQGVSGWFRVYPPDAPGLILHAEGPQPIRQWASLSLMGQVSDVDANAGPLHLYMLPVACDSDALPTPNSGPAFGRTEYLGVYDLRPNHRGVVRQSLTYDSRRLPDGCYLPMGLIDGKPIVSDLDRPLRVENAVLATVRIRYPQAGQVIAGELEVVVQIDHAEGGEQIAVQRVDAYLQRDVSPYPPQRIWLGCDDDVAGNGGQMARIRVPVEEALDGHDWQLYVTAADDRGLTATSPLVGPLYLLGEELAELGVLRPSPGRVLSGVEQVRVMVLQGAEFLQGITLLVREGDGPLATLGAMESVGGGWDLSWDTRDWADGVYQLYALARHRNGQRVLVTQSELRVMNGTPLASIVQPQENERLSGWSLLRVRTAGPVSVARVRVHLRDEQGELYWLGQDVEGDNEWGIAWNTRLILDGRYDLVVHIEGVEGGLRVLERAVTIANDAVLLDAGGSRPTATTVFAADLPERVVGALTLEWRLSQGKARPLSVSLEYSPNDGVHWLPVAQNLGAGLSPGVARYRWDSAQFPDSLTGRLRLLVDDGVRVAAFQSPRFVLNNTNEPPFITLLSPVSDGVHQGQIPIVWRAWDPDGEPVKVDIEMRRGSAEWEPLASGLDNGGQYVWRIGDLPPANDYALRVIARDPTGAVGSDAVRGIRVVDNRPPEVAVLWPTEPTVVTTQAIALWRATDPDGDPLTIDLWYSDDAGQTWLPLAESLPNTGYYVWQVSFLPVGAQYRIRVIARDRHFQTVADSRSTFAIGRNPPPRLLLLDPRPTETVRGLHWIRWFAMSADGTPLQVSPMIRTAGSTTWDPLNDAIAGDPLRNDGVFLWDTRQYPNGEYQLRLVARVGDALRGVTPPMNLQVANMDNGPPQIKLLAPQGGELWSGVREVSWQARAADQRPITATLRLSADLGQTWQDLAVVDARTGVYLWDTRTVDPARRYLLAVQVDDGEHAAQAVTSGPLFLRNGRATPPYIRVLSPNDNGWLGDQDGVHVVRWIAEHLDGDPLAIDIAVTRDGGRTWVTLARRLSNTGMYLLEQPLMPHPRTWFRVYASDGVQRSYADSAPIWRAAAGDNPDVVFLAPVAGDTWSGEQVVRWRADDPQAATASIQPSHPITLELSGDGGQNWSMIAPVAGASVRWDTSQVPNGAYLLRLRWQGEQQSGVVVSAPVNIRNAGRNAPTVSIIEPREGTVWSGTRTIRWRATDPDGDPLSVSLSYSYDRGRNWRPLGYLSTDTSSYVWDTSTAPNADEVWVRVMVSDGRFFAWATASGPIAIRNGHVPAIRLLSPTGGEHWTGSRDIRWETTYENLRPLQVSLLMSSDLGQSWQLLAERLPPSGSYRWDTSTAPGGSQVLFRVLVTDGLEGGLDTLWEPITVFRPSSASPISFYVR
jgi:hypothetical protein